MTNGNPAGQAQGERKEIYGKLHEPVFLADVGNCVDTSGFNIGKSLFNVGAHFQVVQHLLPRRAVGQLVN